MDGTLVGFKRFKSKKTGKDLCVANVVTEYTPAENARGNIGSGVQEVFVPDEQYDFLKENHIGKKIRLNYSVTAGRAYLDEIAIL